MIIQTTLDLFSRTWLFNSFHQVINDFKVVLRHLNGELLENGEPIPVEQLVLQPVNPDGFASDDGEDDTEPYQTIPRPPLDFEEGGPRSLGDAIRAPHDGPDDPYAEGAGKVRNSMYYHYYEYPGWHKVS